MPPAMKEKQHPTEIVEEPTPEQAPQNDGTREPEETNEKRRTTFTQDDDVESQRPDLHQVRSHVSTHDAAIVNQNDHHEHGDEIYDRFPPHRKIVIVSVLSFCSFLAPISSTSILAASPEVVASYNTTGAIFNVSNALYLIFMGLSPLFWGPMGQCYGRKWPLTVSAVTFTAFSLGSALAPNLAAYFVFRMLTAFQVRVDECHSLPFRDLG